MTEQLTKFEEYVLDNFKDVDIDDIDFSSAKVWICHMCFTFTDKYSEIKENVGQKLDVDDVAMAAFHCSDKTYMKQVREIWRKEFVSFIDYALSEAVFKEKENDDASQEPCPSTLTKQYREIQEMG